MSKREPIKPDAVIAWLQETHPALAESADRDRNWVWLCNVDLRGDHNKPTRESIKAFGFRFHFHGGHKLPSGKLGTWGHSCMKPTRFKHKGKSKDSPQTADPKGELSDDALLAMFG